MSETAATVETPKAAKPRKAKPADKKAKAKPQAAREPKELTKTQVRVLKVLAKARGPIGRAKIADGVARQGIKLFLDRIPNESATYNDLTEKSFIREVFNGKRDGKPVFEIDGILQTVYEITAAGRKALERNA